MEVLVLLLIGLMAVVMGDVCARRMPHAGMRFSGADLSFSLLDRAAKALGLRVLAGREGALGTVRLRAFQQPVRSWWGAFLAKAGEADAAP